MLQNAIQWRQALKTLAVLLAATGGATLAATSGAAGHRLITGEPIGLKTAGAALAMPGLVALSFLVITVGTKELPSREYIQWGVLFSLGLSGLPAVAGAAMAVAPSTGTALLMLASTTVVPVLFVADLFYDVPVFTPLVNGKEVGA